MNKHTDSLTHSINKIIPTRLKISLLLFVFTASPLWGLQVFDNLIANKNIFGIRFSESKQEFYALVPSVRSISIHKYVTSTYKVTELNVDTGNASLLRIYATEPIAQTIISEIQNKSNQFNQLPIQKNPFEKLDPIKEKALDALPLPVVFKEYPVTTHAKTIEYQLSTSGQVQELYTALRDNWGGEESDAQKQSNSDSEENQSNLDNEENQSDNNTNKPRQIRTLRGKLFSIN